MFRHAGHRVFERSLCCLNIDWIFDVEWKKHIFPYHFAAELLKVEMKLWTFVCLSFIVHSLQFACIFDIYFKTPLVHGIKDHHPNVNAPASRLVLFSADGLRADKLLELDENGRTRAPFLRKIIEKEGTWGISHSRAPTETRPCHVTIMAGFHEDPSGLFNGFSKNPVKFDSIFNKSKSTWAWGSDDVIPMLAEVAGPHVKYSCFPEGYGYHDLSMRDEWVFENVEKFFQGAKQDQNLKDKLMEKKIVFFLHLLGIDENGHRHNPLSKEYLSNIKSVDAGVKRMVDLIEEFYDNDGRTSYVFTSDHGHLDVGGHGGNHYSETESPLIVWGSGATQHVKYNDQHLGSFEYQRTKSWKLEPSYRVDAKQSDLPVLMASLLGLPVPVNSNGILPLHYLGVDMATKCKLLLSNAQQMAEKFVVKQRQMSENAWFLWPFWSLGENSITKHVSDILDSITKKNYEDAIKLSHKLIELSKSGFNYYHTYHKVVLSRSVALTYIGWIILAFMIAIQETNSVKSQILKLSKSKNIHNPSLMFLFYVIFALWFVLNLLLCKVSLISYLYNLLPLPIFYSLTLYSSAFRAVWVLVGRNYNLLKEVMLYTLVGIVGACSIVHGFLHRYLLSFQLLLIAAYFVKLNISNIKFYATDLCLILAIFPILPFQQSELNLYIVVFTVILCSVVCYVTNRKLKTKTWSFLPILIVVGGMMPWFMIHRMWVHGLFRTVLRFVNWLILLSGWTVPLFQSTKVAPRMLCLYICHCAAYLLLCSTCEALFCVLLIALIVLWGCIEFKLSNISSGRKKATIEDLDFAETHFELGRTTVYNEISFDNVRRCYMLLVFVILALFGMGNVDVINTFDSKLLIPFTSYGPILKEFFRAYKLIFPSFLVMCGFTAIMKATGAKFLQVFCIVTMINDVMNLTSFYKILEADGSWLDIGTSIRNYAISAFLSFGCVFFYLASKHLTTYKFHNSL